MKRIPLTTEESRLWVEWKLNPNTTIQNLCLQYQFCGLVDTERLKLAFSTIVNLFDAFRTQFGEEDGVPYKVVLPASVADDFQINILDLTQTITDSTQLEEIANQRRVTLLRQPFNFKEAPLFHCELIKFSQEKYYFIFVMPHILCDGYSLSIFLNLLARIYNNGKEDVAKIISEYYLNSDNEIDTSPNQLVAENYWKTKFDKAPCQVEFNLSKKLTPSSQITERVWLRFPVKLTSALKALAKSEKTTLFNLLASSISILLYRYFGQEDISLNYAANTRPKSKKHKQLFGFFVNQLALRTQLSSGLNFRDVLANINEQRLMDRMYQDYPLIELLLTQLRADNPSLNFPFNVGLTQIFLLKWNEYALQGIFIQSIDHVYDTVRDGLAFGYDQSSNPSQLELVIEYNKAIFEANFIQKMGSHFIQLLEGIVANPKERIENLDLLIESERHQLLVEWNQTEAEYPKDKTLHELFEEQVERSPEDIALVFEGKELSYAELNARSNQLGHYLRSLGVGPDSLVGICLERSLEMVIGILGILKAGGAYVPLDPDYPIERLQFMLEDTQTTVLVTTRNLKDKFTDYPNQLVLIDDQTQGIEEQSCNNLTKLATPENLAYVIYTSGSTGQPKGVMIEHNAIVNYNEWMRNDHVISPKDNILQKSPFIFDVSVWEFFLPLSMGAKLIIASPGMHRDAQALVNLIQQEKITVVHFVPLMLRAILASPKVKECKTLRLVFSGGDILIPYIQEAFFKKLPAATLYNRYGPTEASINVSCWVCQSPSKLSQIPIGRPVANTQLYILDSSQQPVPLGVVGELYIGGVGLARGYLNREELTKERFIENPFASVEDKRLGQNLRLYRTGDLVRYLSDGNVEYIGRIDHQVKLRGYRIELGEIESVLRQEESVKEAVVIAREDLPGQKRLVAYVILKEEGFEEEQQINSLHQVLEAQLPDYMVPSAFVLLKELPLTATGKLDRKALPAPDKQYRVEEFVAPHTEIEKSLANLWSRLLGVTEISIYDNFFKLGGHSLLATQLNSRIRKHFEIDLPLRCLFETPTLKSLAERISTEQSQTTTPYLSSLSLVQRGEVLPLSFAQQRLWFLEQFNIDSAVYNIPFALRLTGELDTQILNAAFNQLIERHESLRTIFKEGSDGEAEQIILPKLDFKLENIDLVSIPKEEQTFQIKELMREEANKAFDLSKGPLIRGKLLHVKIDEHILLVTQHHIISDGWSLNIFNRELSFFYNAIKNNQPISLEPLVIQYADFALWQRNWLSGEVFDQQLAYWKDALSGMPMTLSLPLDKVRPAVTSYRGASCQFKLPANLSKQLRTLSEETGTTLFMLLLAAFQVLLYRYSGQEEIAVGTPIANRNYREIEELIGFFVNTLVLRASCHGNPSFSEFLAKVKETTLGAYSHQDVSFEQLVEHLKVERRLNVNPIFQVMFAFQNAEQRKVELEGLVTELQAMESEIAKFDLNLTFLEREKGFVIDFNYATELFEEATIERMGLHFIQLLERIVANPNERIEQLPLLTEAERHQLLVEWNQTEALYPKDKTLHELFEEQVERSPESIALVFEARELSYAELNARANQLGHYLRSVGVGPDSLVGLCLERSFEMVIGILGILKAGGAYVPLDPEYPIERLQFMLEDTQASVLVTSTNLKDKFADYSNQLVLIDDQGIEEQSASNLIKLATAENLAYVIYTSGSTGQPKGVMVEHSSVINCFVGAHSQLNFTKRDCIAAISNLVFDIASFELYAPLLVGAKILLLSKEASRDAQQLAIALDEYQITIMQATPATWKLLLGVGWQGSKELVSMCTGEELTPELAQVLLSQCKSLWNLYGPTEITIWATLQKIESFVTIGRPIANTKLYVLDISKQLLPIGVIGELYIGGVGLARGYLNREELTRERFIENPFATAEDKRLGQNLRLYRTGDLVRYLSDGNIEYIGRIDYQLKLRGYRIELGEIESVLRNQESVKEAVVIAREDLPGQKRLVAYVILKEEGLEDEQITSLRQTLEAQLPDYMVPSAFVVLKEFPLTATGKLDRKALPAPDKQYRLEEYVAPRTEIEKTLADIWSELLGITNISIHDNFFRIGGDSILSIQLRSRIQKKGFHVTVKQIFETPTIARLAASIEESSTGEIVNQLVISEDIVGEVLLTPIQHWFFEREFKAVHHYNQSVLLTPRQSLKSGLLESALNKLLFHHDMLRAGFTQQGDGNWVQSVEQTTSQSVGYQYIDLSALNAAEQIIKLKNYNNQLQASLNINTHEVFRAALFDLGAQGQRLLMIAHHLVIDGVSWRILLEDLEQAYQQLLQGSEVELSLKTMSYQRWSNLLQTYAYSEVMKEEQANWLSLTSSEKTLSLPADFELADEKGPGFIKTSLSKAYTSKLLHKAPQAYRTQINDLLLTALTQSVMEWTGKQGIYLSLEGHGREEIDASVDLSRTVGWFTSIYPVYLSLEHPEALGESLKAIKEQLRKIPQKGIGYGILRYLKQTSEVVGLSELPEPDLVFNYLGQFDNSVGSDGLFEWSSESFGGSVSAENQIVNKLSVNSKVSEGQLTLVWTYDKGAYHAETIENVAKSFKTHLERLIELCCEEDTFGYTPSDFPLLSIDQTNVDNMLSHRAGIIDSYPVSPLQSDLLLRSISHPDSDEYLVRVAYELEGDLDRAALRTAWEAVLKHHEILRTGFIERGLDEALQFVLSPEQISLPWKESDWQGYSEEKQASELVQLLAQDRQILFVLDEVPLMRVHLIQLASNRYYLVWSNHHILLDGWSASLVMRDVWQAYQSLLKSKAPNLLPAPSYQSYIAFLKKQDEAKAETFWRDYLQGVTQSKYLVPIKSADLCKATLIHGETHATCEFTLSPELTQSLKALTQYGITLNTVVAGAWSIALSRYSQQSDVVFGVTESGRSIGMSHVEECVGLLINMLPLRVNTQAKQDVISFLLNLQKNMQEVEQYGYLGQAKIQSLSEHVCGTERLFDTLFSFQNFPVEKLGEEFELDIKPVLGIDKMEYPLRVMVLPGGESLHFKLNYKRAYFSHESMKQLAAYLQTLLKELSSITPTSEIQTLGIALMEDYSLTNQTKSHPDV